MLPVSSRKVHLLQRSCLQIKMAVDQRKFRPVDFKNLLQINLANFKQTSHKALLGKGDSNLFKQRANARPMGSLYN